MWLPAILVTTLLCCTKADRNITADVHAFISKFHELNGTMDILDGLENIGESARKLFILGRPIGALLAASTPWEEDSEEARAIDQMHALFEGMYDNEEIPEEDALSEVDYGRAFRRETNYLYGGMKALTISTLNASARAEQISDTRGYANVIFDDPHTMIDPYFALYYFTIHDSRTILQTVDYDALIIGCRNTTEEEFNRSVQIQDALNRLESRAKGQPPLLEKMRTEYRWSYESNFLYYSERTPAPHVDWMVSQIDSITNTTKEALLISFENIVEKSENKVNSYFGSSVWCKPHSQYKFNQSVVSFEMRRILTDLLRLVLVKSSIMQEDEASDEIEQVLDGTGHHIAQWFRNIQDRSWPEIGVSIAKKSIEAKVDSITDYNKSARAIREALEQQGSESYAYQVLIAPTGEAERAWSLTNENYVNITDFNGIDIHIFRMDRVKATERATNARAWLELIRGPVQFALRYGRVYFSSYLRSIISSNYRDQLYRTVILVRKTSTVSVSSETNSIIVKPFNTGFAGLEKASVVIESGEWKAYFLL